MTVILVHFPAMDGIPIVMLMIQSVLINHAPHTVFSCEEVHFFYLSITPASFSHLHMLLCRSNISSCSPFDKPAAGKSFKNRILFNMSDSVFEERHYRCSPARVVHMPRACPTIFNHVVLCKFFRQVSLLLPRNGLEVCSNK